MNKAELDALVPRGYGDHDPEPVADYVQRVARLLSTWPEEVLEDWLHRHGPHGFPDYAWLGFEALTFKRESWETDRILAEVGSWSSDDITLKWTSQLRADVEFQRSPLGAYMTGNGTWPVPILAVRNEVGLVRPDGLVLAQPFHLVEGHHRLGYLRALVQDRRWRPATEHSLWIANVVPDAILDYWPMNDDAP